MELTKYIENELFEDDYFCPEKPGSTKEIFSSGMRYPLLMNIIDGVTPRYTWPLITGSTSATESFFIKLKPIVKAHKSYWIYITDPDNVFSNIEWTREINPEYFNTYVLTEFETNPAVEGGVSYLILFFEDKRGMIVFEYDYGSLSIKYYGHDDRFKEINERLHNNEVD